MSPVSSDAIPRVASKARLQWDEVRSRQVLLYPEGLVALNPTAAEIMRLCDGARSVADIVGLLKHRYSAADIERDVAGLLEGLAAKGLVTYGT